MFLKYMAPALWRFIFLASPFFNQAEAMLQSPTYYFAYGSNMSSSRMRQRMEEGPKKMQEKGLWEGPLVLDKIIPLGRGVLDGYKLTFSKINSSRARDGFATISPDAKSQVEGVIYELKAKHLKVLDFYEGVNAGNYYRTIIKVKNSNGIMLNAFVYIAHPDKIDMNRLPSKEYLQFLLDGAEEFHLSPETIRKLKEWPLSTRINRSGAT